MKIWKATLEMKDSQNIVVPLGADILTVQLQKGQPTVWFICDDTTPMKSFKTINIYGTGQPLPNEPGRYIATFQLQDGDLVFHAFEQRV